MSRKLIEQYRRRPEFNPDGCIPIRLDDGQEWYFPRPMIELRPHFGDDKPLGISRYLTCGEELDELIGAIAKTDNFEKQAEATLWLGGELLKRNYDLTREELERLFRCRPDEPESLEMLKAIIDVATGRLSGYRASPKSRADGLSSVCDPSA